MSSSEKEYLRTHLTKEEVEDVLRRGSRKDARVLSVYSSLLTSAGENYGSVMAAVEITLSGNEMLLAVAKLLPMSPFLREGFDCSVTVRKEIAFYERLVPEFLQLQPDIDLFPKCEGTRATRKQDHGQPVDESAVILLENLKASGYETRERLHGLDLPHCELALKGLGRMHALGIAVKLLKPTVFQDITAKVAAPFHLGPKGDQGIQSSIDPIVGFLENIPACAPHLSKVRECLYHMTSSIKLGSIPPPREPFCTIVHNDFWTNNMMFWYDVDKNPKKMKVVDFQITLYDSPVKDVLFFLYTSLELGLREKSYSHLLSIYHRSLTDQLGSLGVDTADFSLQNFYQEIDYVAQDCFGHLFFLHRAIFAEKPPDMTKFSNDDFVDNSRLGELYKVRISHLIEDFARKGWL